MSRIPTQPVRVRGGLWCRLRLPICLRRPCRARPAPPSLCTHTRRAAEEPLAQIPTARAVGIYLCTHPVHRSGTARRSRVASETRPPARPSRTTLSLVSPPTTAYRHPPAAPSFREQLSRRSAHAVRELRNPAPWWAAARGACAPPLRISRSPHPEPGPVALHERALAQRWFVVQMLQC